MQQTLQQAVQRNVALHKCDVTLHAALRAFLSTQVKKQVGKRKLHQKRMQRCMQHSVQRGFRVSEIGREFCCTSKTHVIAADGSLHIQTAHPKRKCNRPLNIFVTSTATRFALRPEVSPDIRNVARSCSCGSNVLSSQNLGETKTT
jgi:hypothetical protein